MGRKYTNEELKNKIENEMILWTTVKVLKIENKNKDYLIHLIDDEGYKYCIKYGVIRVAKSRNSPLHKFYRNNIYTIDNIKNFLLLNNKTFSLVSSETNKSTEKLVWCCPTHGYFKTSWNSIKNGTGCPKCGKIIAANKRRNTIEYVKSKFEENNLILMADIYKNNETPLLFICNKHKLEGIQRITFGNLITGGGCKYCFREKLINSQTKSHEKFLEEVNIMHGSKYKIISKYTGSRKYVHVYCNYCKETFYIMPYHLLAGHGCNNCTKSIGEETIREFLIKNNIIFKQQYKFDNCRGIKRKLPFDFAILNNNKLKLLIEYQGIQHYKAVSGFGGEEQFKKQQYYDQIKYDYCLKHNIKLLIIPYWELKNIKKILQKELIGNSI